MKQKELYVAPQSDFFLIVPGQHICGVSIPEEYDEEDLCKEEFN